MKASNVGPDCPALSSVELEATSARPTPRSLGLDRPMEWRTEDLTLKRENTVRHFHLFVFPVYTQISEDDPGYGMILLKEAKHATTLPNCGMVVMK